MNKKESWQTFVKWQLYNLLASRSLSLSAILKVTTRAKFGGLRNALNTLLELWKEDRLSVKIIEQDGQKDLLFTANPGRAPPKPWWLIEAELLVKNRA